MSAALLMFALSIIMGIVCVVYMFLSILGDSPGYLALNVFGLVASLITFGISAFYIITRG